MKYNAIHVTNRSWEARNISLESYRITNTLFLDKVEDSKITARICLTLHELLFTADPKETGFYIVLLNHSAKTDSSASEQS